MTSCKGPFVITVTKRTLSSGDKDKEDCIVVITNALRSLTYISSCVQTDVVATALSMTGTTNAPGRK